MGVSEQVEIGGALGASTFSVSALKSKMVHSYLIQLHYRAVCDQMLPATEGFPAMTDR